MPFFNFNFDKSLKSHDFGCVSGVDVVEFFERFDLQQHAGVVRLRFHLHCEHFAWLMLKFNGSPPNAPLKNSPNLKMELKKK